MFTLATLIADLHKYVETIEMNRQVIIAESHSVISKFVTHPTEI